jgi:hypothetical protein
MMRAILPVTAVLLLSACGDGEPEVACCAIEPRAKCEGHLLGSGVTDAELTLLLGPAETICPSATLSETRIRELATIWSASDSCKVTRSSNRLRGLEAGLCPARTSAHAPPLPPGVDINVATACAAGLIARGISEPELWLVLGAPEGVCPSSGINERRLRDIIAKDWNAASCTQFTPEQMLHALDTGACGGDAG